MIWYLHTCKHCGTRIRRGRRIRTLAKHSSRPFPIPWIDSQGNMRCTSAMAVIKSQSFWYDRDHQPELFDGAGE